jgi:hypothetical protein
MVSRKITQITRWQAISACAAAALTFGCGGGSSTNGINSGGGTPSFQITSPSVGATVAAAVLSAAVQASNFQLVTGTSGPNVAGRGHLMYWLDADPTSNPSMAGSSQSFQAGFQLSNLTPGSHTLWVELRNIDGTPLSPRVIHSVTFTYTPGAAPTPAFQISGPAGGASITGTTVDVTVQPTDFQVVPAGPNQSGQGHLEYWLDTDPSADPATAGGQQSFAATFQLTNVAAGNHTLWIELRNSDDTALSPRVIHSVAFTTAAGGGAPPASISVQFARDIVPILTNNGAKTCAAAGCHSGGSPMAGMNLEAANAYANIVGVVSSENAALMRVKASDSANSYLFQKINSGQMPLVGGKLADADIQKIKDWIDAGAPNN